MSAATPSYRCDGCAEPITNNRVRVHCLVCSDYDSCADCHLLERVSGSHVASHQHRILKPLVERNKVVSVTETANPAACSSSNSTGFAEGSAEAYWGKLEEMRPTFSRLIGAIYAHLNGLAEMSETGWLEPEKFCILLHHMGYSTREFPCLSNGSLEDGEPVWLSDLDQVDSFVASFYRKRGLDFQMVGGLRGRRSSAAATAAAGASDDAEASHGSPVLSESGFVKFVGQQIVLDPSGACLRLNMLLRAVGPLVDSSTNAHFRYQELPRACFPLLPDADLQEEQRRAEEHVQALELSEIEETLAAQRFATRLQADNIRFMFGGWRVDKDGHRHYEQGIYEW